MLIGFINVRQWKSLISVFSLFLKIINIIYFLNLLYNYKNNNNKFIILIIILILILSNFLMVLIYYLLKHVNMSTHF